MASVASPPVRRLVVAITEPPAAWTRRATWRARRWARSGGMSVARGGPPTSKATRGARRWPRRSSQASRAWRSLRGVTRWGAPMIGRMLSATGGRSWSGMTSRSNMSERSKPARPGLMQWTMRQPKRDFSHSATAAERRPAESTRSGASWVLAVSPRAARLAGDRPSREPPGARPATWAIQLHASGMRRNGRPSRSAIPSAWAAVPARGSSSTQMRASGVSAGPGLAASVGWVMVMAIDAARAGS